MKRLLSELIVYRSIKEDPVLVSIADVIARAQAGEKDTGELRGRLFDQVHEIMEIATTYGFTDNLWAAYIVYLLMNDENPLALVSEKRGITEGSAAAFARHDFESIRALLHYDVKEAEVLLETNVLSTLQQYRSIQKNKKMYYSHVSRIVNDLTARLLAADSADAFYAEVDAFYKDNGVGMFGLNKAFRILNQEKDDIPVLVPINNLEQVCYDDLVGYERQKKLLFDNTAAFVEGRAANNVLLYGDAGTGKSTSVKATLNEFYPQGLRLIEIYKHQMKDLSYIISTVKKRNYRFVIFMDDLSFEDFEIEYKYLKAVIEGGFETRPDNILIYATSNRRHLIKENLSDRKDMIDQEDIHHSDTMEEKLSLVDRFGLNILYTRPTYDEYHQIVLHLAEKYGITTPPDELIKQANTWSVRKGGYTGRIAQQFINSLNPKLEE